MSTKLPIGDTINEAFQFGLHRWGSVLRFAWLPVVVSMVVILATALLIFDFTAFPADDAELASMDEAGDILRLPLPVTIILGIVAYILIFLLMSGVLASIYRLAALGEDRRGVFQLRMDGPAKRVFFAFFVQALINLIIWVVALSIGLSMNGASWGDFLVACQQVIDVAAGSNSSGELAAQDIEVFTAPSRVLGLAPLIAFVLLFYVNIKLAPFAAGSAAENRLWLVGSFVKTTGHFWSILGITILLFLLMIVIAIIFQIVMFVVQMLSIAMMAQGSALAILGVILSIAIIPAMLWYGGFIYALQFGLQGIIYRRLTTGA